MKEIVLLLVAGIIAGIFSFGDNVCMCLTWKLKNSNLVLTCRIPNLKWSVHLYDPSDKEQGFCIPPRQSINCYPYYKNVSIYQNVKTNETVFIFTGNIDYRINGNWTCRHGSHADYVTEEVTLPKMPERETTRKDCWSLLLFWTITGFVLFYILSQLFIYTLFSPCMRSCLGNTNISSLAKLGGNIWRGIKFVLERIANTCKCAQEKKDFSTKVIKGIFICFLVIVMIGIPIVVGFTEKGMCSGHLSFIPVGVLFGFIIRILRIDKRGTEREQNLIKECFLYKCQEKQEQISLEEGTNPIIQSNIVDDNC